MTGEEAKKAIDELKAQGDTEEEILAASYLMFADDKLSIEDLEIICDALGYEMTEEFKNMSPEDQKTKGYEPIDDEAQEGVSKEEIEDAKEITPEEKEEDSKEEKDLGDDEKEEPKEDDAEESDDEKAKRLFGFGDKK